MKINHLTISLAAILQSAAFAGVPVRWTAETSRVQPQQLEAWTGDTLDLECTLKSYGQPMALGTATASFMWQTNGMGSTWWQTNATVSAAGVVTATWSPSMWPGAGEVAFFLPVQTAAGASYRAAGRLRFRPSPGAGSQIVDLPQPGGTLDFGEFQLVNAPWATLDAANAAIAAAVTSATGALVIPPAVDLSPYATTGYVATAVQMASSNLATDILAVSNATIAAIPSLAGYATQSYVADYFATNYTPPDLSSYASRSYADAAASNAQATAIAAIPSLDGYATQSYVADYFATNYTPPDLSSYASRSYADAAASNAQAAAIAAIPSLAGYATQDYVADYVASNTTPPDLSSYASRSYADAAASNAQAAAIAAIPSLAGYATQSYVADYFATNYTPPDLSSYASRSYADAAASNAQVAAIAAIPSLAGYATEQYVSEFFTAAVEQGVTVEVDTTRLSTPDGLIWQDATGVVWQADAVMGWTGQIWTNTAPYSPAATGFTSTVTFWPVSTNYLEGTFTNAYWGRLEHNSTGIAWISPQSSTAITNEAPASASNTFAAIGGPLVGDPFMYYSADLALVPVGIVSTNYLRRVAYTDDVGSADSISDGAHAIYADRRFVGPVLQVGAWRFPGTMGTLDWTPDLGCWSNTSGSYTTYLAYTGTSTWQVWVVEGDSELTRMETSAPENATELSFMAAGAVGTRDPDQTISTTNTLALIDDIPAMVASNAVIAAGPYLSATGGTVAVSGGSVTVRLGDEDDNAAYTSTLRLVGSYGYTEAKLVAEDNFGQATLWLGGNNGGRGRIMMTDHENTSIVHELTAHTNGQIAVLSDLASGIAAATNALATAWTIQQQLNVIHFVANGMAEVSIDNFGEYGTLSATTNGWPEGASMFARILPRGTYIVGPGLRIVGYGTWPTNDFQAVAWRYGTNVFVNVLVEE